MRRGVEAIRIGEVGSAGARAWGTGSRYFPWLDTRHNRGMTELAPALPRRRLDRRWRAAPCGLLLLGILQAAPARGDGDGPRLDSIEARLRDGKPAAQSQGWVRGQIGNPVREVAERCYAAALGGRPRPKGGRLEAGFAVLGSGAVRGLRLGGGGIGHRGLRRCLSEGLGNLRIATERRRREIPTEEELPGAYAPIPESQQPPPPGSFPLRVVARLRFPSPPSLPAESLQESPGPRSKRGCRGPSPAGCRSGGCPAGLVCRKGVRCVPSTCSCNPARGTWTCTADCGGGVCVPPKGRPGEEQFLGL